MCMLGCRMDWGQIAHHMGALTGSSLPFYMGHSAGNTIVGLWLLEMPNPFMYMRYFLWCLGMAQTPMGRINEVRRPS